MSVSEEFFSGDICHMETSQFICIVYQLANYYVIWVFAETVSHIASYIHQNL